MKIKLKFGFTFYLLILLTISGVSQPITIDWQQCYGGTESDYGYSVLKVNNGFLVFCGTGSYDGQVIGTHGMNDFWLVRTDMIGNLEWQRCYGGSDDDIPTKMIQCKDGGFLLCGQTFSIDGDVSGNHGSPDYWLLKVDSIGTIAWSKCFGGSGVDWPMDVVETADSGFLVCGMSGSDDGEVTGNHGFYDAWIIRVDHSGVLKWERSYGGITIDYANSILSTSDGGFIFCGLTDSQTGDVSCNLHGLSDTWIVKCDAQGDIDWQQCYGGSDYETGDLIAETNDGGYLSVTSANSTDGDVTGNHGKSDIWVVRTDHTGSIVWKKCYGGSGDECPYVIKPIGEGSFLIGGYSTSNDGDVSGNHSQPFPATSDMWLIKISGDGTLLWQQCFGGIAAECIRDVLILVDGQLMLIGFSGTSDNSGDIQCDHHGPASDDAWMLMITDSTEVGIDYQQPDLFAVISFPNPADQYVEFTTKEKFILSDTKIAIFNSLGRSAGTVILDKGESKIRFDCLALPAGIYFYSYRNDRYSGVGKMMVVH